MEGGEVNASTPIVEEVLAKPPPSELHGIDAYRKSWPPLLEWLKRGVVFELVSLDVTCGADVAFATALLRCGTEEEPRKDPNNRLRLTVGLRNEGVAGSSRTSTVPSWLAIDRAELAWPS